MITTERRGPVAVLKLDRGTTNPIHDGLVGRLDGELSAIEGDPGVSGLVLASASAKFFSIGLDLPGLLPLDRDALAGFLRRFDLLCLRLTTFPKPAVAAITGHAVAGGCVLALACDYRFIAEGRRLMGLNETKLGVPIPHPAECMLRQLVGYRVARDLVDGGAFHEPEALARWGLVDRILPLPDVLDQAIAHAGGLAGPSYAAIKDARTDAVRAEILAGLDERERRFLDCWFSAEGQERLREAAKKF